MVKRFLAVAGIVGMLTGGLAATSAGTQERLPQGPAAAADCLDYLSGLGYESTPDRVEGCAIGEGIGLDQTTCWIYLRRSGVVDEHARQACQRAQVER